MEREFIRHRLGFPNDGLNKYRVLIVEGGDDDGLVIVESPDGRSLRPNEQGQPEEVKFDDCIFRVVGGDHDSFEDAATVMLFFQEREILIRAASELAQLLGKNMTAEWYGQEVAHVFHFGGILRVEDLQRGTFVHSPPVSAGDRIL
jgi:hypothetical protein